MSQNKGVPAAERVSLFHASMDLAGVPICVSGLLVGAALTKDLSLVEGLKAATVGCLVLTVYAGLIGQIGTRTGRSTSQLLQGCFGAFGTRILAVAIAICLAGWYAVQTEYFGQTIHTLFPNGGVLTSPTVAALWGGLLMFTTALFGFRGLTWLSMFAVPLLVLLSAWGLVSAVGTQDIWLEKSAAPGAFSDTVTMVIGSFALGATVNADLTRYCRSVRHSWIVTVIGFFIASLYIFACGAITAVRTGSGDLIGATVSLGMGASAFVVLILAQWTTNDNNLYYAATSVEGAFSRVRRVPITLAFGLTATLAGVLGITDRFVDFLVWLGVLVPPIGGVLVAHYLIKRDDMVATAKLPLAPMLALVVGVLVGRNVEFGAPSVNAIISAGIAYLLLRTMLHKQYASQDKV